MGGVTSGPGTRVLKEATTTIPIVMAVGADAVADGVVASLARPGGNVTGSTFFGPELSAKRLEILKGAVPRLARVAVLPNPENRNYRVDLETIQKTAVALNVELFEASARSPREFDDAFALMVRRRADGLGVEERQLRRLTMSGQASGEAVNRADAPLGRSTGGWDILLAPSQL